MKDKNGIGENRKEKNKIIKSKRKYNYNGNPEVSTF